METPPLPNAPVRTDGTAPPLAAFFAAVRQAIDERSFEALLLSRNRDAISDLKSVRARLIALRGEAALSLVHAHATRDVTKNFAVAEGLAACARLLDADARPAFAHATLHTAGEDVQLMISKKGRQTLRRHGRPRAEAGEAAPTGLPEHDRARARRLPLDLPFLVELGLTDASHRLVPSMARKWRQIDKFLEVLDDALDSLPTPVDGPSQRPLRVVDFGCGKGYLTFAVHEHLRRRFGIAPQVTGVELRPDLVDFCNGVAARCGAAGLAFVQGDLRSYAPEAVDVMIALHACDTATDHAIDLGLRAGADVLVCSPCCHKELRPQMASPRRLSGVLRHGIHLGQEAEMVTDSLRALLLEACGYDARVFEFVSLEHTSKNKMILATRRREGADTARALAEVRDVKDFYGIREQCLEMLLQRHSLLSS
ncbi:MAG: SAM-dependent methyltransferase [Caldimonas sp.]